MPLRCIDDAGMCVQSHFLDEHQWAALKAAHKKQRHLRMPCCNELAVLKTSRLGTQFFAHHRRGECTTKPESAEHLLLKSLVAQAAVKCGWTVATEVRGQTEQGEEWVADVLATRGKSRVALEIQWSRQTESETYARQARYKKSGVRGLWLFKQSDFPIDHNVPAVQIIQHERGVFEAVVKVNNDLLRLSVEEFIHHAFSGRFWYGLFPPNTSVTATVYGGFVKCWKCDGWTNVVSEVVLEDASGHEVFGLSLHELPEVPSLMQQLPLSQGIPQLKVGKILMRYSKTEGGKYLANGCVRCNALQGKFFLREIEHRLKPIISTKVLVSTALNRSIGELWGYACCWHLDLPDSQVSRYYPESQEQTI